eukprot:CAMPEP_0115744766 /NCGR_PEP_ID=MMETSP0272-20121206/91776_1 /TAXON_ID=71861 /ORGANISM="Scrippsiella trochoidea, Strain CCMP3099" /LENGTH=78 /DNA_ID=CAMNT_0003189657 /DNA_START=249 /DNA_END=482 /DNA_ORIENTATION=+
MPPELLALQPSKLPAAMERGWESWRCRLDRKQADATSRVKHAPWPESAPQCPPLPRQNSEVASGTARKQAPAYPMRRA